jgi:large subunit ribosomal protein L18
MARTDHKLELRRRRHSRVRRRVHGSSGRPRLAVFRSNKHISAQLIDDDAGRTLASASSVEGELGDRRAATSTPPSVWGN